MDPTKGDAPTPEEAEKMIDNLVNVYGWWWVVNAVSLALHRQAEALETEAKAKKDLFRDIQGFLSPRGS